MNIGFGDLLLFGFAFSFWSSIYFCNILGKICYNKSIDIFQVSAGLTDRHVKRVAYHPIIPFNPDSLTKEMNRSSSLIVISLEHLI